MTPQNITQNNAFPTVRPILFLGMIAGVMAASGICTIMAQKPAPKRQLAPERSHVRNAIWMSGQTGCT